MNRIFITTPSPALIVDTNEAGAVTRNVRLQYLRAVAALSVLLFHASVVVERTTGSGGYLTVFSGFWGALGVAIFFALSGYLMRDLIQRDNPARFLVNRIARIYPPMLLTIAIFWAAFFVAGFPRGIDLVGLTLAPAGVRDYFLGVEWTLIYEISYYAILAGLAAFGLRRLASLFALAWVISILGSIALTGRAAVDQMPLASELPLQAVNLPFLLGFLLVDIDKPRALPSAFLLPVILVLLVGAYVLPIKPTLAVILPAFLLVLLAVRFPAPAPTTLAGRAGERLGDASYMLYLCHLPLMTLLSGFVPGSTPSSVTWLSGIGASILLSLVLGRADLSLHRWFKKSISRASRGRVRNAALFFVVLFLGTSAFSEYSIRGRRALEAQARDALSSSAPTTSPSIRAEVDAIQRLPDGTRIVRGYAIDLDKPALAAHAASIQKGQVVAIERARRQRTAQASAWSRPDLAGTRFGFVLTLPKTIDCAAGNIEIRVALQDGRVIAPAIAPQARICP